MNRTSLPVVITGLFAAALLLAGCAPTTPESTPVPEATADGGCAEVGVVVDFGVLDEPPIAECVSAGIAVDVLADAGITTAGTVDYGDQVICRVNEQPAPDEQVVVEGQQPFTESCQTLNSVAYWALWFKAAPDAEWEYAQEGATTLELTDGQSVGLVYTPGTDSIPPQG